MKVMAVREEDAEESGRWRQLIRKKEKKDCKRLFSKGTEKADRILCCVSVVHDLKAKLNNRVQNCP